MTGQVSDSAQRGFVLPAALAVIAMLALGASALLLWLERVQAEAGALQARAEDARALADARATVLHALAIEPLSPRGVEFVPFQFLRQGFRPYDLRTGVPRQPLHVRLDARPYTLAGGVTVRLQDARGLVNLNAPNGADFERLLLLRGFAAGRARALTAALLDYADGDQLVRPDGAEAAAYRAAGRAPPPDRPLRDVGELALVLGADTAPSPLDDARLLAALHAGFARGLNVNSASGDVLQAAGFTPQQAASLLAVRRDQPVETMADLQRVAGLAASPDPLRFPLFPADELRIELERDGRVLLFGITLTPRGADAPWRIDYLRPLMVLPTHADEPAPLAFPDVTAAIPPA